MADEEVTKDPTSKRFWRTRNLVLLALTALLPVAGKAAWDWAAKYVEERQSDRRRIQALEGALEDINRRVKETAMWEAIADVKNQQLKIEIQMAVIQKLFDREFARSEYVPEPHPEPDKPKPEKPPDRTGLRDFNAIIEELKKKYGADYVKTDEYRKILEQKYPNFPVQKK